MINLLNSTNRKVLLFVLAMVAFASVLVAQITPPSKETAPAETGQVTNEEFDEQLKAKIAALPDTKSESDFRPFSDFGLLKGKAYDFPIWPGTKAWANSKDPFKATDVPKDILKNMSTDDLLATIMDYPLRLSYIAYDDQPATFRNLLEIPLFQEFFLRQDAAVKVINFYESLDPEAPKLDWGSVKIGDYCTTFSYLEMLLLASEMFDKLTSEQDARLLQQMLDKAVKMDLHPEFYGNMNGVFTPYQAFLAGKILLRENASSLFSNPETEGFLNGDKNFSEDVGYSIFSAVKQFLLTIKK